MVASSSPIDQFVARHPSFFFDASPEHALVNPDNLHILVDHVKCAAFELPFTTEEGYGQVNVQDVLAVLQESGLVRIRWAARIRKDSGTGRASRIRPMPVSLRSISSDNFVITDHTAGPKVIGETDFTSALSTLHPKAIYMVEGKVYQVEELDFVGRKAHVREVDCDYYTTAITYTKVTILDRFAEDAPKVALPRRSPRRLSRRWLQEDSVPDQRERRLGRARSARAADAHDRRTGVEIPLSIINVLPYATDDRRDGVIGLAFAMKQVAQLLLMCDARDIGLSVNTGEDDQPAASEGWSRRSSNDPGAMADTPRIFLYDAYPGGIGFSAPLWGMQAELLSKTSALLRAAIATTAARCVSVRSARPGPLARRWRCAFIVRCTHRVKSRCVQYLRRPLRNQKFMGKDPDQPRPNTRWIQLSRVIACLSGNFLQC